jgi:hypothetical protein
MWTAAAAVAAILGIAVGRLWDSRAESARWHRDQTIASYQRLAEAFRSYDETRLAPDWPGRGYGSCWPGM